MMVLDSGFSRIIFLRSQALCSSLCAKPSFTQGEGNRMQGRFILGVGIPGIQISTTVLSIGFEHITKLARLFRGYHQDWVKHKIPIQEQ
jgi:hypothetical protein